MDKDLSRRLALQAGVRVAPGFAATVEEDAEALARRIESEVGFPAVVKPVDQGSSVGFQMVKADDELEGALRRVSAYGKRFLVEKYIEGFEVTAAILGGEALPLVEIRPRSGVYDYRHKYTGGASEYLVPAPLEEKVAAEAKAMALAAFEALGCSVYGRVDLRVSPEGKPYFLEVNTLPGMTAHSLVPKAAREAGMSFEELVQAIIDLSLARFRP